jgi:short-subunit dehydrogenase
VIDSALSPVEMKGVRVEKLVFCFQRSTRLSRSAYFEHYLQHHAPLGMRLAKAIAGYTINFTDVEDPGAGGPDAITEIWTTSSEAFMDPALGFDCPDDAAALAADHDSFMGPFDAYVVEERIVRRRSAFEPLGTRTMLAKRVALYGQGEQPPEAPPEVVEVVEHRVRNELSGDGTVRLIVTTLAPTVEALGPPTGRSYTVSEFRQREPTGQELEFAQRYGPWAVVAGASEGIGSAFCQRLAAHGINLVLIARREDPLMALAEELQKGFEIDTRVVPLDLSGPRAEERLFSATAGLDVGLLIYNAGADPNAALFLDIGPDVWTAMVERNCIAPLKATHHYASAMVARGHGGILLVTSGAAWAGGARIATYSATKAFDLVLGESLWAEFRDRGVDVLSLVVGSTDTPALRRLLEQQGTTVDDLAAPNDVAKEGLEHLGAGPTWAIGMPDGGGPSPLGSLPRRLAVELMTAGMATIVGQ